MVRIVQIVIGLLMVLSVPSSRDILFLCVRDVTKSVFFGAIPYTNLYTYKVFKLKKPLLTLSYGLYLMESTAKQPLTA